MHSVKMLDERGRMRARAPEGCVCVEALPAIAIHDAGHGIMASRAHILGVIGPLFLFRTAKVTSLLHCAIRLLTA